MIEVVTPTPIQLVWSIFAVAVIVILFTIYHVHLEKTQRKKITTSK